MIQITRVIFTGTATQLLRSNPRRVAVLFCELSGASGYVGPPQTLFGSGAMLAVTPLVLLPVLWRSYGEIVSGEWWWNGGVAGVVNCTEVVED